MSTPPPSSSPSSSHLPRRVRQEGAPDAHLPRKVREREGGPREGIGRQVAAGVVGAVTGYASSFTVVLTGLAAVGATPAQAASGLVVMCALQGVLAIALSWRTRIPVSFAWSTPGAAVLVAAGAGGVTFPEAVGAFLLCGALVVLTGAWPALSRLVTRVPAPLSGALLAGVLLPLCLAPVTAVAREPLAGGAVVVVWLVLRRLAAAWAVPAALVVALVLTLTIDGGAGAATSGTSGLGWAPVLTWTTPQLDPLVLLSIGVPLYLVTMASQNVPGLAVLRGAGYPDPPARAALVGSGGGTLVGAPFGVHALNLAALSAAIMAGPDVHPDPRRRWPAAVTGGVAYLGLAALSTAAAALVSSAPPLLVQAVAGLALLGAFLGGLASAVQEGQPAEHRTAALLAFLVVASGVSVAGIGSAVWGLLAGALCYAWLRPRTAPEGGRR
ncbi:benzoate/H(+) symporter BenE family transporter [Quadrisphaera setariae]|uniref:Benzoate/H(+) symporter BenE family transporter n=1 Tax=Quadrisphaera setariae TaxID=2593304 RepID=A0A5C8Z6P5_9ACTN|nr:benzoate/H(+) symporter BenE family transporter [Quadrisphaera setariae]